MPDVLQITGTVDFLEVICMLLEVKLMTSNTGTDTGANSDAV
jgi:hypothetical protein